MLVPKHFLSQGVLAIVYIINRLPSWVFSFKSPVEVLQGTSVDLSHLKVFRCTCFVHKQTFLCDKFDPRAKCVFLGYSSTKKEYKCYHPDSRILFAIRDVKFEETTHYYYISSQDSLEDIFPLPML